MDNAIQYTKFSLICTADVVPLVINEDSSFARSQKEKNVSVENNRNSMKHIFCDLPVICTKIFLTWRTLHGHWTQIS